MPSFLKHVGGAAIGLILLAGSSTALAQTPTAPEEPDHDQVVGRLGVGYLGASQIQVGVDGQGGATLQAPVIGIRYWFDPMVGLDVGLGFGMSSGETKYTPAQGDSQKTKDPSYTAFLLHAGVPLSLSQGKHYSFQIVPEANLGFGSGSQDPVDETVEPKVDYSGFRLDVGARAGAELHFGFIGVPELSLQGSVGLQFVTASAKTEAKLNDQKEKYEQSATRIGTTVGDNPWNIFTTNVAALYYF